MKIIKELRLAIIGLGYVGLPLAVEFAKRRKVIGFDINSRRIEELKSGFDKTFEINNGKFKIIKNLELVKKIENIKNCNCFIITVPTPINKKNKPDAAIFKFRYSSKTRHYTRFHRLVNQICLNRL